MPITINQVNTPPRDNPSRMQKIAMGVDMASKILNTGLDAYKIFGVDRPNQQSETARNNALANYYTAEATQLPTRYGYEIANPSQVDAGRANQLAGQGDTQWVPKQDQNWLNTAMMHQNVQAGKQTTDQNMAFRHAQSDLEALRGNPALQMAQRNILLAQNAKSVIAPYQNNLDQTPQDQVALFDQEMSKMAMGGVPTDAEMHSISDPTLYKNAAALVSKVKNAPQGAGQAAFLPNKIRYLNDVQQNSMDLIQKTYQRKLDNWQRQLNPADYANLQKNMGDFLGSYQNTGIQTQNAPGGNAQVVPTPGPHGPSVVQGGHTYNWNPQTKQYE